VHGNEQDKLVIFHFTWNGI